jgi:hypothetical protein
MSTKESETLNLCRFTALLCGMSPGGWAVHLTLGCRFTQRSPPCWGAPPSVLFCFQPSVQVRDIAVS